MRTASTSVLADLHARLVRELHAPRARREFALMRERCAPLADFEQLDALLAVASSQEDRDRRDGLLAALVEAAHDPSTRHLAHTLLWLALWEELRGLFFWLQRRFHCDAAVLLSELAFHFHERVARLQPRASQRVVANLLLSTRRELFCSFARQSQYARLFVSDGETEHAAPFESSAWRAWGSSLSSLEWSIVVRVAVFGEEQGDVAASIGVSHDATRKRYQRALRRLSTEIAVA